MKEHQSKVVVYRRFNNKGQLVTEQDEREAFETTLFPDAAPVCTVSAERKLTKNLGDYNSAQVGVFVSVPCILDAEELANALAFAGQFAESHLERNLSEFEAFIREQYPLLISRLK